MADQELLPAYFALVTAVSPLSRDEETALFQKLREGGRAARQRLVAANQRIVIKVARQYTNTSLSLGDLIGEGNLGLLRAIDKFDASRGCRFCTYAMYWIRQSNARAIQEKAPIVRPPVDLNSRMRKYRGTLDRLSRQLGRRPFDGEMAASLDVDSAMLDRLKEADHALTGVKHFGEFECDGSAYFKPRESELTHGSPLDEIETRDTLHALMRCLDARERAIVEMRYGLNGTRPMVLREIADRHSLTRSRIQQIVRQAIEKMATHGEAKVREESRP